MSKVTTCPAHTATADFTSTADGQVWRRRRTTPSVAEDPAFPGAEGLFTIIHPTPPAPRSPRQTLTASHRKPLPTLPPTSPCRRAYLVAADLPRSHHVSRRW